MSMYPVAYDVPADQCVIAWGTSIVVIMVCVYYPKTHNRYPALQPAPAGCGGSSYLVMHVYPMLSSILTRLSAA